MFERLTDNARRTVVLAQDSARALGHHRLGTEHILSGLLQVEHTFAPPRGLLTDAGVGYDAVQREISRLQRADAPATGGMLPFTERAKSAFESLEEAADRLGDAYIAPRHLLLAVLADRSCHAVAILGEVGCDTDRLAQEAGRPRSDR